MEKDKYSKMEREVEHFPFMKEEDRHPIEEPKKLKKKINKLKLIILIILGLLVCYVSWLNDYSTNYNRAAMYIKNRFKSYIRLARYFIEDAVKVSQRKRYDGPDVTKGRINREDGKTVLEK